MNIAIAHQTEAQACVAQLKAHLAFPRLVVFFASPRHDAVGVSRMFKEAFAAAQVIGCSTAGEISSEMMSEGSIVAMGIGGGIVDKLGVAAMANAGDSAQLSEALRSIGAQLGCPVNDLDPGRYVGLVLIDGLSAAEEVLMDKIGDATNFPFLGGSAGDDLAFQKTYVTVNGQVYDHGVAIAVLHLPHGYEILKAQGFRPTGKHLTATAVDEAARTVRMFDGQPAGAAYARALGVPIQQLPGCFIRHPVGLMIDGEPFVRSPRQLNDDGSITFYCNIRQGMELEILEATDIVADTRSVLTAQQAKMGTVAGLIDFNCILRTLELRQSNRCAEYARLFAGIPSIGFSTYGEQFTGHMNQTATMLLLAS